MPNIAKVFKDEIARISRKEAKQAVAPFRKSTASARRTFAELKRRLDALEKECKRFCVALAKGPQAALPEVPAKGKGWISGKGVRSLRQKLGLSQEAFAKLVGVTPNCISLWEGKSGMLRLRGNTRTALLAARQLGAREAKDRLAKMVVKKAKPAGKRRKK